MAGKFQVYKDKAGEFRFRLIASNGQTILSSEGYKSKSSCMNGIESVKSNCADMASFDRTKTSTGKFRFALKAKNKQIIGTSQNYTTASARNNGVASIGRAAPGAKVDDQT